MAEETPEQPTEREKWLVAAWPGMGNVGVGACAYLLSQLTAKLIYELPARDVFELQHVEVKDGLAKPGRLPRSMFFQWNDPRQPRDLLIFLGEAQPSDRGYSFCHRLLDYATSRGISRVITFAAMATQLHPADTPNVLGIATDGEGIRRLQSLEVKLLKEGQISGLNGVLLAAAAERNVPGMCLLGELPYFAAAVPNPKSSKAVLEVFSTLGGLEIDFTELDKQAEAVERGLIELLEKLQDAAKEQGEGDEFSMPEIRMVEADEDDDEGEEKPESLAESDDSSKEPSLDYESRARIESLFEAARRDRAKAVNLKAELDRLGVFRQYEDRFLDLFKRAE